MVVMLMGMIMLMVEVEIETFYHMKMLEQFLFQLIYLLRILLKILDMEVFK